MRLTILFVLLSFTAYGQANLLLGLNRQKEAGNDVALTTLIYDSYSQGTGTGQFNYVGTWPFIGGLDSKATAYGTTISYTNAGTNDGNNANDPYVEIDFDGISVAIISERYTSHGIMAVSIDGGTEVEVDQFGVPVDQQVLWSSTDSGSPYTSLSNGPHTLKIRNTGKKNAGSSDTYLVVDAISVNGTTDTPPPVDFVGDYYVAKTGCTGACSDSNDGLTRLTAFLTIQKAASVLQPGEKAIIYGGTYRETVTPFVSGTAANRIRYIAAPGETVIISGLETASGGWTLHSGNIYKRTMSPALPVDNTTGLNANLGTSPTSLNNTTLGGNQIFKDGDMMIRARWPNAANFVQMFDRTKSQQRQVTTVWSDPKSPYSGFGPGIRIVDPAMPNSSSVNMNGGTIWVQGWYQAGTKTINYHSGTEIRSPSMNPDSRMQQFYHVEGTLGLLDIANEWHYDPSTDILYVWQPGGGTPTGIEYKARNWGFDLQNRSYINIEGVQFYGCEVMGNTSTNFIIIDNIKAYYQNYVKMMDASVQGGSDIIYWNVRQTGFRLLGTDNVIKNSEFRYSMGQAVAASTNCLIQNNLFDYINPNADYAAAIGMYANAGGIRILYNTIRNTGRSSIDLGEIENGTHYNAQISYNDMYNWNMMSYDGGAIYGGRNIRMTGTVVDHNWIHDSQARKVPNNTHSGTDLGTLNGNYCSTCTDPVNYTQRNHVVGLCAGFYYDQSVGPSTIHHNVFWNNYEADLHLWHDQGGTAVGGPTNGQPRNSGKSWIYNNTLATNAGDGYYSHHTYLTVDTNPANLDVMRNNISLDDISINFVTKINGSSGADIANGVQESTNPLFVGGLPTSRTDTYDGSGSLVPVTGSGTIASPAAYFQLQSGSPARNVGVLINGINSSDTGGYEAGAYYFGVSWTPGYNSVPYNP